MSCCYFICMYIQYWICTSCYLLLSITIDSLIKEVNVTNQGNFNHFSHSCVTLSVRFGFRKCLNDDNGYIVWIAISLSFFGEITFIPGNGSSASSNMADSKSIELDIINEDGDPDSVHLRNGGYVISKLITLPRWYEKCPFGSLLSLIIIVYFHFPFTVMRLDLAWNKGPRDYSRFASCTS